MEQLEGDLDVFGDSSVVIKRWPGHTPGSQMAIVRLPKTGTVVLTSDNVYFSENVTKNLLPDISLAYNPTGILNAYEFIRCLQGRENAELHDRPRSRMAPRARPGPRTPRRCSSSRSARTIPGSSAAGRPRPSGGIAASRFHASGHRRGSAHQVVRAAPGPRSTSRSRCDAGEVMGLLGPNGSGKTTLLRILTGYLRPSAGHARIAGLDVVSDSLAARARVGYVPEDAPLYGWMGVREFLTFMARLKGLSRRAATGAVDGAIERLALGEVQHAPHRQALARLPPARRDRPGLARRSRRC